MNLTRRTYLQGVGALAVAANTGFAGCMAGAREHDHDGDTPAGNGGSTDGGAFLPTEPAYDSWFKNVATYRGTQDMRGQAAAKVVVGAKDSLGHFSFAPAALAVSPGTTVTWEWSGKGGGHDVVALDGGFKSPLTDRAGTTFVHTFDVPGVYKYYCTPHQGMGMKGAIVVME